MDGFYVAYLTGKAGNSLGVFTFINGIIVGADVGGVIYEGSYQVDSQNSLINGILKYKVSAGGSLITGFTAPHDLEFSVPFQIPASFADGNVVRVDTPNGPVNAKFQKIRGVEGL